MNRVYMTIAALCMSVFCAEGQSISLDEAIAVARTQSVMALEAKQAFVSSYWAYKSYTASRLPSLSVYGNFMNFDKSLALVQSYEDGNYTYVNSYNLQNSIGLRLSQNIGLTGGTLTMYSDISRIDQFHSDKSLMWYSQPLTLAYRQPLFSFNQFKWDSMIEPKEYEIGRRAYLESMEKLSLAVVKAYFNLMLADLKYNSALSNYSNTFRMLSIAGDRLSIGSITRDDYLQLELRTLNDSIAINENAVQLRQMQMEFNSVLGYDESVLLYPVIEEDLPDLHLDYLQVIDKFLENGTFALGNEISLLQAESEVARAKASRGFSVDIHARFGLSNSANNLPDMMSELMDQETVGVTFSIPIFDWGVGKGKVAKAKAAQEVVKAQIQQSENDIKRTIFAAVSKFNNQKTQCQTSKRAMEIAGMRYSMMIDKFRKGSASVLELNNAQEENDNALQRFVQDLNNFWQSFYTLRAYTLYDFCTGQDLIIDETELIGK